MQVLTDQVKVARPGVTIYGIGDEEHKERTSGHNEDDTPGVKAEDQDADSTPEHRAIDVMPGTGTFTTSDGDLLTQDLTREPANQARLIYVNWKDQHYHRKNNWVPVFNSDYHSHVHVSGEADADANTAPWYLPRLTDSNAQGDDDDMFCRFNDKNQKVASMQFALLRLDPECLPMHGPDGGYGDETANAMMRLVTGANDTNQGRVYEGQQFEELRWRCMLKAAANAQADTQAHTHTFDPAAATSGPADYVVE